MTLFGALGILNRSAGFEKPCFQIVEAVSVETVAKDDHELTASRQLGRMLAKQLTENSFTVVSLHSVPHPTTGDYAESWFAVRTLKPALKYERPAVETFTQPADLLKFARFTKAD